MGIMRKTLIQRLKSIFPTIKVCEIYGYITKYWRERKNIQKTHISDAFVVAKNFDAERLEKSLLIVPKRSHNRQIHKCKINKDGYRKLKQTPKFMFGFQLFDKVRYKNQEWFVASRRTSGCFKISSVNDLKSFKEVSYKKLKPLESRKSLLLLNLT